MSPDQLEHFGPVYPKDTQCAICNRMYSAAWRASIKHDPNACSDYCLGFLPESVRAPWPFTRTIQ